MAGVSGNGQRELGDLILGSDRVRARARSCCSARTSPVCPIGDIRAGGVSFIPENPLAMAAIPF